MFMFVFKHILLLTFIFIFMFLFIFILTSTNTTRLIVVHVEICLPWRFHQRSPIFTYVMNPYFTGGNQGMSDSPVKGAQLKLYLLERKLAEQRQVRKVRV